MDKTKRRRLRCRAEALLDIAEREVFTGSRRAAAKLLEQSKALQRQAKICLDYQEILERKLKNRPRPRREQEGN